MSQAQAYKGSVGTAVTELLTQLTAARDQLESSYLTLTGQQTSSDMAMPAAAEPAAGAEAMPPEDAQDSGDDFAATDAEAGGTEPLGRERR
jgi:hypothetical protein